jgi:hypothetical protein
MLGGCQPVRERRGLGFEPGTGVRVGHRGVAGLVARGSQFAAQLFGGALALLTCGPLLVELSQRAPFAGLRLFLGDDHLLAGALELRRELGTPFCQLAPRCLQFRAPGLPSCLRRGVRLTLRGEFCLHGFMRSPRLPKLGRERQHIFARGRRLGARGILLRLARTRDVAGFCT